jgi:Transposase DDE domain
MKVRGRVATRSALALARKALAVGSAALPAYASPYSKRDFTQAQLFAMLCLKQFLRQDYRGLVALLKDWSDLRQALRLKKVPHYSTLCYAQNRLATRSAFKRLLEAVSDDAFAQGLAEELPEVAVDATGFESRHCSRYFVHRRGERRHLRERWPKLTLACHTQSHLVVGALATIGPSQDSPQFAPVARQAVRHLSYIDRLLADAGYDGEHNHALARERLGIRSTVIALNRRGTGRRWPKTRYRRQMKRRFQRRKYHQRWQAESVISRIKRRLGSSLSGRSNASRRRESRLRVLTHDLMLLRRKKGFQQSKHRSLCHGRGARSF